MASDIMFKCMIKSSCGDEPRTLKVKYIDIEAGKIVCKDGTDLIELSFDNVIGIGIDKGDCPVFMVK